MPTFELTTRTEQDTTYILSKTLPRFADNFVLADFVKPATLPDNSGKTARWRYPDAVSEFKTAIGNTWGTNETDNETAATFSSVTASPEVFGAWQPIYDEDMTYAPKDTYDAIAEWFGYSGAKTLDSLLRDRLDGEGSRGAGTATVHKSASGAGGDDDTLGSDDTASFNDILLATGDLLANNAPTFSNGMYAAVIRTEVETQIMTEVSSTHPTWFEANKFTSGATGTRKITKGFIGAARNCMVFRSNNMSSTPTVDTTAAYSSMVLSSQAIGGLNIKQMKPRIIRGTAQPNPTNPHGLWSSIAFQFRLADALLQAGGAVELQSAQ